MRWIALQTVIWSTERLWYDAIHCFYGAFIILQMKMDVKNVQKVCRLFYESGKILHFDVNASMNLPVLWWTLYREYDILESTLDQIYSLFQRK